MTSRATWLLLAATSAVGCDRNRPMRDGEPPQTPGITQSSGGAPVVERDITTRTPSGSPAAASNRRAVAEFKAIEGLELEGKAKLEESASGVKISLTLEDAPPGRKGVHVHEKGDCSDIPGESMGKHFAPHSEPHGLPPASDRHPGDLGNIVVDKDGNGQLEIITQAGTLKPGEPMSFLNRSIVVHQGEDKGTQPSGDAGKPMACAVIRED